MIKVFTSTNEYFGECKIKFSRKCQYLTFNNFNIRIDPHTWSQLDRIIEGEGTELDHPIYYQGKLLKYFINELKDYPRYNVKMEKGKFIPCDDEGNFIDLYGC